MRQVRFQVRREGDVDLVRVNGVLDLSTSPRLRTVLRGCLVDGPRHLVVDVSGVDLMDCGAVGVLVVQRGQAEQAGGSLRVTGAEGLVREVLEVTGVAKGLGLHDQAPRPVGDTADGDDTCDVLLRIMATVPEQSAEWRWLREEVIECGLPYAESLARRFQFRGEPLEDLTQVAALGLVKAIDRYDCARGSEFFAFATPTILGEIKRYFRDKGWRIRVPRRLQELRLRLGRVETELAQQLGRTPLPTDYARHLEVAERDVLAALAAASSYRPASLSAPLGPDTDAVLADPLGSPDPGLDAVENSESLRVLIGRLPHREQRILLLRFFGNMTQAQIAAEVGLSQMHVSRLLARTLGVLREGLLAG
ncbi:MAG TPA: SigB/SigF/SigG family RNA polymerase sigma factor [Micromonosporaceae bacterium]|nr:SigB/SigF/SigG family RNA polymerase sigma factor [Micromonosporaceae bacterium]